MDILSSPSVAHVVVRVCHACQSRPSWRVRAHVYPGTPACPCALFEPRVASSSTRSFHLWPECPLTCDHPTLPPLASRRHR
eukprot:2448025-Rhodomonas_salina.2